MPLTEPLETNGAAPPIPIEPLPKRGRGRPRTRPEPEYMPADSGDEDIELLLDADDLHKNADLDIFQLMQAYPAKLWETELFAYLYRTAPMIDRNRTGNNYYLQKYSEPFDMEKVKKDHGSGRYKITLCRTNMQTRQSPRIREEHFGIMDPDYPPRVPLTEWVDDPKNSDWAWAKAALEREAAREAASHEPHAPVIAPAQGPFESVESVLRLADRFMPKDNGELVELVKTLISQQSNKGQGTELLLPILLKMMERPNDTGMQLLLEQMRAINAELAAERQANRELLQRQNAGHGLKGTLEEMAGIKELARGLFGAGAKTAEPAGTDWAAVGVQLAEKVIDAAPAVVSAFAGGRPAQLRRTVAVTAQPAGVAAPSEPQQQEGNDEVMSQIEMISRQFGPVLDEDTYKLVEAFQNDWTGMDFREWFIEERGMKVYRAVRSMSPQTVLAVLEHRKTNAPDHVKAQLAYLTPASKLAQFINEFLSDAPAPGDGPDSGDETPMPEAA